MKKYSWDKDLLEETVKNATCWNDWLKNLNIPTGGCNYETLKSKAALYGIDTSHFNIIYARTHRGQRIIKNRTNEQIFIENGRIKTESVKIAYIDRILHKLPKCECCGIENWNGKIIVFQLHHKDGNNKNNRIENLQLLCPNCHSQTDNFSNRKRK